MLLSLIHWILLCYNGFRLNPRYTCVLMEVYFQLRSRKYWWPSRCLLGSQPPIALLTISWEISIAMVTASCWCHPDQVVGVVQRCAACIPIWALYSGTKNYHHSWYHRFPINHWHIRVWKLMDWLLLVIPSRWQFLIQMSRS